MNKNARIVVVIMLVMIAMLIWMKLGKASKAMSDIAQQPAQVAPTEYAMKTVQFEPSAITSNLALPDGVLESNPSNGLITLTLNPSSAGAALADPQVAKDAMELNEQLRKEWVDKAWKAAQAAQPVQTVQK